MNSLWKEYRCKVKLTTKRRGSWRSRTYREQKMGVDDVINFYFMVFPTHSTNSAKKWNHPGGFNKFASVNFFNDPLRYSQFISFSFSHPSQQKILYGVRTDFLLLLLPEFDYFRSHYDFHQIHQRAAYMWKCADIVQLRKSPHLAIWA